MHGLLAGRAVRLLVDAARCDGDEAARRFAAHLSRGAARPSKAAWVDGFLSGGGMLLVHDPALLGCSTAGSPAWPTAGLRRRAAAAAPYVRDFEAPERRNIGERGPERPAARRPAGARPVDERRAAPARCAPCAAHPGGAGAARPERGPDAATTRPSDERLPRWRLVLGGAGRGIGLRRRRLGLATTRRSTALWPRGYDTERGPARATGPGGRPAARRGPRRVGAAGGALARRHPQLLPATVVQVMQRDAIDRSNLRQLLLEPEMLEAVEPDVHLVGTLLR